MTLDTAAQVIRWACLLVNVVVAGYSLARSRVAGDSGDQRRAIFGYASASVLAQLTLLGTPLTIRTAAVLAATVLAIFSLVRVERRSRRVGRRPPRREEP